MFARVSCPACQYKLSIPEGDMGKRFVCPNCQSPFFAGKTLEESAAAAAPLSAGGPPAGFAKTMLGETAPAIKYNCPRCKAPLEAPASEAGTKKPCPSCGQRLQVPAAAPAAAAAAQPNLNKTLLAADESKAAPLPPIKYNCPNCKKPLESPASEAGTKKNCPACSQRLQVPAAAPAGPNLNKTILASDEGRPPAPGMAAYATAAAPGSAGNAAAGQRYIGPVPLTARNVAIAAGILLLLLILIPAVIRGGKFEDAAAMAKAQQDLEKVKAEIEARKAEIKDRQLADEHTRQRLEEMGRELSRQDEQMRENHRSALRAVTDDKLRTQLEEKFERERRDFEQKKRDMEKTQQEALAQAKAAADASRAALEAAQQRQQTIIQQPPPVIYYPPYSPRYYWPWW
jgi:DNA-directed RNA polymerase subunit RPC12/RpoP